MLTLLLKAIQNLTRLGTIKSVQQAYQLAKRELGDQFNAAKKQIDDAFNQGKKQQTLDKRTKDIKKTEESGIKSLETGEEIAGLAKSKTKIEKEADKLKKVAEENKADPDELFALKSDPVKTDTPLTQKLNKAVEEARQQMKEIGSLSDADRQKKQIQDALRSLRDKRIYEMGSGKEGDVRTALRQFLQKELETGKLDIPDAYERKMIAEVRQGGVDPIDVFRKAYGEDALIAVDDIFEQYGDRLRGPTYRDIEENFRKLFKMNRGFYDMADLPVPKKEYGFEPGLQSVDSVEEELMKQYRQLDELDKFEAPVDRKPNAEGGIMRASYSIGSGVRLAAFLASKGKNLLTEIKKAVDNIFSSGDSKYDADAALDDMFENLNVDRNQFDQKDILDAYGEAYNMITKNRGLMSTKVPGGMKPESSTQVFKDSKGGIKGITMGGDKDFQKAMSEAMEEGMRESENMRRLGLDPTKMDDALKYDEMKEAGQLEKNVTGSADLSPVEELKREFPGITDEMIENILTDTNPQRIAEVKQAMREAMAMEQKGMSVDEIINTFKNQKRTKQATGGRVRAASGGLADILKV